jgi:hypothetical protein
MVLSDLFNLWRLYDRHVSHLPKQACQSGPLGTPCVTSKGLFTHWVQICSSGKSKLFQNHCPHNMLTEFSAFKKVAFVKQWNQGRKCAYFIKNITVQNWVRFLLKFCEDSHLKLVQATCRAKVVPSVCRNKHDQKTISTLVDICSLGTHEFWQWARYLV